MDLQIDRNNSTYCTLYNKPANIALNPLQYEVLLAQIQSNQWTIQLIRKPKPTMEQSIDAEWQAQPEYFHRCSHQQTPAGIEIILFKDRMHMRGIDAIKYSFATTLEFVQTREYPTAHHKILRY